MQPDPDPGMPFFSTEERELLSIVQSLSPAQKRTLALYLCDYAKGELQKKEQQKAEPSHQRN